MVFILALSLIFNVLLLVTGLYNKGRADALAAINRRLNETLSDAKEELGRATVLLRVFEIGNTTEGDE